MSWLLDEIPRGGAIPREETWTRGPQASLRDIVMSAFDEQYRANSVLGVQSEFLDRINSAKAKDGTSLLPSFSTAEAKSIAEYLEDGKPFPADMSRQLSDLMRDNLANTPDQSKGSLKERFDKYEELTGGGMTSAWTDTKKSIRDVLDRAADVRSRSLPVDNFVWSLIGGIGGAFTTRDPVNLATVFVGGVGKSALTRIASEVGLNSGIEAINVLTGVADNRRLAGVPMTPGEIVSDIALTGVGAGVLRGGFEGLGALARRFGTVPEAPPAPVPTKLEPSAPSRGLVGDFTTPEGFTGQFSPVIRAGVPAPDERVPPGSSTTTAQRLRVDYLMSYLDDARVPPLARGAVTADFGLAVKAVDQALAGDLFKGDATLADVAATLGVKAENGEVVYPLRFLAGNLLEEDVEQVLRQKHPSLYTQRAQLEARISNLEATIRQSSEHVKTADDSTAARKLIDNEARIAEWRASLERGEYPKKRQRELVEKDIADLEAKNVELRQKALARLPGGGKNIATRLSKLTEALGEINHELAYQRFLVGVDRIGSTPRIEVAAKLHEMAEAHERALSADDGAKYDAVAEAARNPEVDEIELGDINLKGEDLDLEVFDADTGKVRPLREIMRDLTKDNNLEKSMNECVL